MGKTGWLVILGLGLLGAAGASAAITYRTSGMSAAQRAEVREAVAEAYARAQTCEALAAAGDLKDRAIAIYESGDLHFEAIARDPDEPYQCAYTLSGFLSGDHVHLRPMAFTDGCNSLASTVFHEVLHAAMPFSTVLGGLLDGGMSEEQQVTTLEHACFPEFYTNVRGLHPAP